MTAQYNMMCTTRNKPLRGCGRHDIYCWEVLFIVNFLGHLKTINHHKKLVKEHCFRLGLYRQGLLHDISKYNLVEFLPGVTYYQGGKRSPNNAEREVKGYSGAWMNHKGRNKHHLEYWIDYSAEPDHQMCGMEMPIRYVLEMFCDRVAASKNYLGENYTNAEPYEYFQNSKSHYILHPKTEELLEKMLRMLKEEGEEKTFDWIREEIWKPERKKHREKLIKLAEKIGIFMVIGGVITESVRILIKSK